MLLNSRSNMLDRRWQMLVRTASQTSMVVGEHEALAAKLAVLFAATSGDFGPQPQCIFANGKAACRIACRAACCHALWIWDMGHLPTEGVFQEQTSAQPAKVSNERPPDLGFSC